MNLHIDKLKNEELIDNWNALKADKYVLSLWKSPSYEGIKGLVSLQFNFTFDLEQIDSVHKSAFHKLVGYFIEKYQINLDISGSDTTRLCFVSYDPNLIIKDTFLPFEIDKNDLISIPTSKNHNKRISSVGILPSKILYHSHGKNNPYSRYLMSSIIRFLEKRKLLITYAYHNWMVIGNAIANSFTYDIGLKYFLRLSALDESKYNEENCKRFLANCYKTQNGRAGFGTILYFAGKAGYKIQKRKRRGTEVIGVNLSQFSSLIYGWSLARGLKKVTELMSVSLPLCGFRAFYRDLFSFFRK